MAKTFTAMKTCFWSPLKYIVREFLTLIVCIISVYTSIEALKINNALVLRRKCVLIYKTDLLKLDYLFFLIDKFKYIGTNKKQAESYVQLNFSSLNL